MQRFISDSRDQSGFLSRLAGKRARLSQMGWIQPGAPVRMDAITHRSETPISICGACAP